MHKKNSQGFTLLEILIVIAILAVIVATVLPSFSSFRQSSVLNTDTMNVVTLINRARILSVSAKNDTRYGIHLEAGKAVLFDGGSPPDPPLAYSPGDPKNETFTISEGLSLTNITVNGGGSDVWFEKITGETNNNATTTLLVTGTTASTTIVVQPTGIVTMY